jgi:hypothetical protein
LVINWEILGIYKIFHEIGHAGHGHSLQGSSSFSREGANNSEKPGSNAMVLKPLKWVYCTA